MIPEITIDDKTLQEMADQVLRPLDQALGGIIRETATPCVQSAENFLISIRQSYEDLAAANIIARHQNKLKKAMQNPQTSNTVILADEYARNKQILKEMYLRSQVVDINIKLQDFSRELNSFLNQKTKLTYVYTNNKGKDPVVFLVDDIGQIMSKDMGSRGAGIKTRINMSKAKAMQAIRGANTAIQRLAEEDYMTTQQIKNLKGSYNQVINRYNKYRYQAKTGQNKSKTVHVIIWRPELDWKVVIMGNNMGDIKQAYVNAIINRKGFISPQMEKNIDDFMYYVSQVDAAPGMLQGDVSEILGDGSTIEYAVKGANASFMSLQLAIDLAIEILTAQPPFDQQALKRKKEEYAKGITPRNQQITIEMLREFFQNNIPDEIQANIQLI